MRRPPRTTDEKSADRCSRCCWGSTGLTLLRGQACTALAATCSDDRAARTGAHTSTESVHTCTTTVVRLERPLALGHGKHSSTLGRLSANRTRSGPGAAVNGFKHPLVGRLCTGPVGPRVLTPEDPTCTCGEHIAAQDRTMDMTDAGKRTSRCVAKTNLRVAPNVHRCAGETGETTSKVNYIFEIRWCDTAYPQAISAGQGHKLWITTSPKASKSCSKTNIRAGQRTVVENLIPPLTM